MMVEGEVGVVFRGGGFIYQKLEWEVFGRIIPSLKGCQIFRR